MTINNKDKDFDVINSGSWKSLKVNSKKVLNLSCFLPFGKAGDTESPSLSRVRGSLLQLHPRRLGSPASSTFATSGFNPGISSPRTGHYDSPPFTDAEDVSLGRGMDA